MVQNCTLLIVIDLETCALVVNTKLKTLIIYVVHFFAKSLYLYLEVTGVQVVFSHNGVSTKGHGNTENPMTGLTGITVSLFTS